MSDENKEEVAGKVVEEVVTEEVKAVKAVVTRELTAEDRVSLAKNFGEIKYAQDDVNKFCLDNELPVVDYREVGDYVQGYKSYVRINKVRPFIFEKLSKLKATNEFMNKDESMEAIIFNANLADEISVVLEKNGIMYHERDLLDTLSDQIKNLLDSSSRGTSNACMVSIVGILEEKFGSEGFTIKDLVDEQRRIADSRARETDKPKEVVEETKNKGVVAEVADEEESSPQS